MVGKGKSKGSHLLLGGEGVFEAPNPWLSIDAQPTSM